MSWQVYLAAVRDRRREACAAAADEAGDEVEIEMSDETDEAERMEALAQVCTLPPTHSKHTFTHSHSPPLHTSSHEG